MSLTKLISDTIETNKPLFPRNRVLIILIGTAILSFGIMNVHRQSGISEGGVLGMILLGNHWLGAPPSVVSPMLDLLCYAMAFKTLGKDFLKIAALSTASLAGFFAIWGYFPPVLPSFSTTPLLAAILGGLFVGIGVGLVVRQGGSTGGDDALALTISKLTGLRISIAYLATDLTVLLLSLSYIPLNRIAYSVISVTLSSLLIDKIKDFPLPSSGNKKGDIDGDEAKPARQDA